MWDWMSNGVKSSEEDEMEYSFKDVLLAAYDTLCETLPENGGLAYKEAVYKGSAAGLEQDEAEAFAALYFTLNHERSPMERNLDNGKEFVPLAPLLDDAVAWFSVHQGERAAVSLKKYAATSLTETPMQADGEETIELTQLITTGKVIFPTSKAFWKQPIIAREGVAGVSLSVDNKNTLITASISDLDGEQVKIASEQQHLQAVIGQMILENGAPITVTPAQLYRAFAGLPADADVTEEQEACMVEALDPLLKTAAQLDFTQEIEKHTRLKRAPDYDYKKTRLTGALVTGMKVENGRATYNGKRLDVAYIIYAAPMYFLYSKAVNQLATVDRAVLLGGATKKLPAGHPDQKPLQRRARAIVLRRYLMAQVERIKRDSDKSRAAAIAKKQPPPATHTERLTFDTIAEACDISLTPKIKQQLRHDVKKILLDFKYNSYVRDATDYKEGRAIKGMKITV